MSRKLAVLALLLTGFFIQANQIKAVENRSCTRDALQKVTDSYISALKKGDSSLMPIASGARYIEKMKIM